MAKITNVQHGLDSVMLTTDTGEQIVITVEDGKQLDILVSDHECTPSQWADGSSFTKIKYEKRD